MQHSCACKYWAGLAITGPASLIWITKRKILLGPTKFLWNILLAWRGTHVCRETIKSCWYTFKIISLLPISCGLGDALLLIIMSLQTFIEVELGCDNNILQKCCLYLSLIECLQKDSYTDVESIRKLIWYIWKWNDIFNKNTNVENKILKDSNPRPMQLTCPWIEQTEGTKANSCANLQTSMFQKIS